jgi:diguanylate cyclase (GGDEF)-like protein
MLQPQLDRAEGDIVEIDVRIRMPVSVRQIPFAAAATLAWVTVIIGSSMDWSLYAIATALLLLSWLLGNQHAKETWLGRYGATLSSLVFLAAVGLMRNSGGGINSGVGILALIPVFYTALLGGSRRQLGVVLAGMTAFYLMPIVIVGPPAYPQSQYRAALLTVAVSSIIGFATQRLVADVRHQAADALSRERMLEQMHDLMRDLSSSTEARIDVCEAARSIGEACMALIYEPVQGTSTMRSTAIVGAQAPPAEISLLDDSAVTEAFMSGRARLITENVEAHVGSLELWKAAGSPQSVLYEPLMRGSDPVGVLVVGWPARIKPAGTRATIIALLAHEAASVIDRADTLSQLTDLASTDPLTGLPNRRAWDARVNKALNDGERFTIAILDLDHFKEFNDAHGHPTGDLLLKETAAVWREQLRGGDMLARLGGEEFGLLLFDCDRGCAVEVIERLRKLVYRAQTCSAGFAARREGEAAEAVMARADAALYDAKASGRNRVCMSA